MAWTVRLKKSAPEDLHWFGQKMARILLATTVQRLVADPLAETRNMKTLRPNRVAQRELRLLGKYRVLFDVNPNTEEITIVVVGEKLGEALFVQGEEFTSHYESNPPE